VAAGSPTAVPLAEYMRHAELFGVELVYETASGNGFSERELARLRVELDAIEAGRKRGRFTVGSRRRRTPEETAEAVRMLRDEGLVIAAIADKLGISDRHVKRCLNGSERPKNSPATPHGYAAKVALSQKTGRGPA
jgi:hypothetical protein